MVVSRIAFALIAAAFAPGIVMAQTATPDKASTSDEVVSAHTTKMPTDADLADAKAKAAAAQTTQPTNSPAQVVAWLNNASQGDRAVRAPADDAKSFTGDRTDGRTIHGSAGVSIGTGGYRSAYVSALIPVGENGTLGIAVSQTDYGKNNAFYGGRYGRYGYGQRGGTSNAFAVSLDMNGDGLGDTPQGCAPGFRDRGRYIEPLWVSHLHGDQSCLDSKEP